MLKGITGLLFATLTAAALTSYRPTDAAFTQRFIG